jgi:hypothetical protein
MRGSVRTIEHRDDEYKYSCPELPVASWRRDGRLVRRLGAELDIVRVETFFIARVKVAVDLGRGRRRMLVRRLLNPKLDRSLKIIVVPGTLHT